MADQQKNPVRASYRPPSQEAIEKIAQIMEYDSVKEAAEAIIAATGCPREDAYYTIARDVTKKET